MATPKNTLNSVTTALAPTHRIELSGQQRNACVRAQRRLDPGQIRLVVEIGGDRLDGPAGLILQALGQDREPALAAGDQDQVVATLSQAVCVDGADACGGAGDQ